MTLYQNILMWVSLTAAFALAAAGVVVWCDMRGVLPGRRILQAFLRLPGLVRLFLVAFVVQLVVHGSTKTNATNGVEGGTTNAPAMMTGVPAPGVGHARYGVVQPAVGRVPTGVVLAQKQWRRGCWSRMENGEWKMENARCR